VLLLEELSTAYGHILDTTCFLPCMHPSKSPCKCAPLQLADWTGCEPKDLSSRTPQVYSPRGDVGDISYQHSSTRPLDRPLLHR
jgi:hypothetical protein